MPKPGEVEAQPRPAESSAPVVENISEDEWEVPQARGRSGGGAPAPVPASASVTPGQVKQLAEQDDAEKVRIILLMAANNWPHNQVLAAVGTLASTDNEFLGLLSKNSAGQRLIDEVVENAEAVASMAMALPNVINGLALGIPGAMIGLVRRALNIHTFTAIAIHQVFDVNFTPGSWSNQSLRKMYLAMRMVPKTHVQGAVEKLDRNEATVSSDFASKGKVINMARLPMNLTMGGAEKGMRVLNTRWMGSGGLSMKFLMKQSPYSQAMRSKNAFSMTALHEIGHAVDHKLGVMDKFQKREDFGGWEIHGSGDAVLKAMWNHLTVTEGGQAKVDDHKSKAAAFDAQAKGASKADRTGLSGKASAEEAAAEKAADADKEEQHGVSKKDIDDLNKERSRQDDVKRNQLFAKGNFSPDSHDDMKAIKWKSPTDLAKALTSDKAKLATMKEHPIVKAWEQGSKMQAWARSRAELDETAKAFGGRTFHQAYPEQWVSFKASAKDTGVSHYAFRAPGEWFSELYAHYYMGTLKNNGKEGDPPTDHPMYGWFHQAIHSDERNRPDGDAAKGALKSPEQVEEMNQSAPAPQATGGAEQLAEAVAEGGAPAQEAKPREEQPEVPSSAEQASSPSSTPKSAS